MQESAAQQRVTLQAAKAAGLLHKVTVADAQQVLDSGNPASLLAELTAAPVTPANVFLSEPYYSLLESLPPWSQLRYTTTSVCMHALQVEHCSIPTNASCVLTSTMLMKHNAVPTEGMLEVQLIYHASTSATAVSC